ncbi:cell wall adhesin EAP1-like [Zingiber officinale]|uniref:cell wall adhesin EAP1-like n=1 Tax=Zingiber officinale TaxID=94328 RepID=UPI001C4C220B|nr:cell wall adhesin EAP1-like [Zingiber officinale]
MTNLSTSTDRETALQKQWEVVRATLKSLQADFSVAKVETAATHQELAKAQGDADKAKDELKDYQAGEASRLEAHKASFLSSKKFSAKIGNLIDQMVCYGGAGALLQLQEKGFLREGLSHSAPPALGAAAPTISDLAAQATPHVHSVPEPIRCTPPVPPARRPLTPSEEPDSDKQPLLKRPKCRLAKSRPVAEGPSSTQAPRSVLFPTPASQVPISSTAPLEGQYRDPRGKSLVVKEEIATERPSVPDSQTTPASQAKPSSSTEQPSVPTSKATPTAQARPSTPASQATPAAQAESSSSQPSTSTQPEPSETTTGPSQSQPSFHHRF